VRSKVERDGSILEKGKNLIIWDASWV
jgi:hypothetical protein